MMLSLGKHTTSRDIEENSTSCYLHIPFDPSAEEGGGSVLIYAYSKYPSISTNFKFLVIKCKKKKDISSAADLLLSSEEAVRWQSEWRQLIISLRF